jgi:AcrR family transcriptional regulator
VSAKVERPARGAEIQRRDAVCRAAMGLIVERGIERVRVADIARQVGMSAGHVLYYFGTKDRILLETLRWSEYELSAARTPMLRLGRPGWPKLRRYVDLYLAEGPSDPRWTLWLETWKRTRTGDLAQGFAELEAMWRADLASLITEGVASGVFPPLDVEDFSIRFMALLDGLSIPVLEGVRDRKEIVETALRGARIELEPKG